MASSEWSVSQRELFDELSTSWWDESGILYGLGVLLDPVRVPFITDLLRTQLGTGTHRVLDLGAGGGLLSETLAAKGLSVVALDPSVASLHAGMAHGTAASLVGGTGERLPFADGSFDAVLCMEVLEHVDDPGTVVGEAARVLRRGGVFIFSGPNRTLVSRIGVVLIAQDLLGVVPRGTHQWSRFLSPGDMNRHMMSAGIEPVKTVGVGLPLRRFPGAAVAAVGIVARRLTYPAAAGRIHLASGTGTSVAYQGFGVRI